MQQSENKIKIRLGSSAKHTAQAKPTLCPTFYFFIILTFFLTSLFFFFYKFFLSPHIFISVYNSSISTLHHITFHLYLHWLTHNYSFLSFFLFLLLTHATLSRLISFNSPSLPSLFSPSLWWRSKIVKLDCVSHNILLVKLLLFYYNSSYEVRDYSVFEQRNGGLILVYPDFSEDPSSTLSATNPYRPNLVFRPKSTETPGSPETRRNRPKSHPRWNRGACRSILLVGTRFSGHSSWNGTVSITV